jgi:hypothetical protein
MAVKAWPTTGAGTKSDAGQSFGAINRYCAWAMTEARKAQTDPEEWALSGCSSIYQLNIFQSPISGLLPVAPSSGRYAHL